MQAPSTTVLLASLAPSTGDPTSSFAEITLAVLSNATAAVPGGNSVTVTDGGSRLGSTRLTAVNGSGAASTFAGFIVATLPAGTHQLVAQFGGSDDLQPSSSLPLAVAAGGAAVPRDDTKVPAPFPQGDAPGNVRVQAAAAPGASYRNIAQNEAFRDGSSSWVLQGGSLVSASSASASAAAAAVKLGQGSYIWQPLWVDIVPHSAYILDAHAWVEGGSGLVGATFYDGVGTQLGAAGVRVTASAAGSGVQGAFVAPPGACFAAVWAGKWDGGGALQVAGLAFGPQLSGPLSVDCSVRWRSLSAIGPGMVRDRRVVALHCWAC
jgi:hypothetical protein